MVNIGFGLGSILGLLNVLLALGLAGISIALTVSPNSRRRNGGTELYIGQMLIVPICLFFAGGILFFQGWRLDPVLLFAFFLLNVSVVYMGIKDLLLLVR